MGRSISKKRVGGSSDNVDRAKASTDHFKRDKATINRLQMYRGGKPVRDKDGRITGGEFMGKNKAGGADVNSSTGRVAPDRRWFGNTRVISAPQLDRFREVMATKASDPYAVVLHSKSVPMGLLVDTKVQRRAHLLSAESFKDTFGKGAQRKRPRIAAADVGELLTAAETAVGSFQAGSRVGAAAGASAVAGTVGANVAVGSADAVKEEDKFTLEKYTARDAILTKGTSKRIWAELYRVLDCSDVVVQVLDARDPQGTRSLAIEKHLRESAKHKNLIFVLNKVDLVPTWVTRRWVAALSREAPCLAFTAGNLKKPFGKGSLIALLRQLSKLHADKKAISVGFVGYPNVGKSSIINALKGSKACNVAPIPGETKVWQYVTLMKRVFLIGAECERQMARHGTCDGFLRASFFHIPKAHPRADPPTPPPPPPPRPLCSFRLPRDCASGVIEIRYWRNHGQRQCFEVWRCVVFRRVCSRRLRARRRWRTCVEGRGPRGKIRRA
jgi:nuclear GTP-binding protein